MSNITINGQTEFCGAAIIGFSHSPDFNEIWVNLDPKADFIEPKLSTEDAYLIAIDGQNIQTYLTYRSIDKSKNNIITAIKLGFKSKEETDKIRSGFYPIV